MSAAPVLTWIRQSDARIDGRVRAWDPPEWFVAWMIAATRFGDGWGWLAVAVLLLAAGGPRRATVAAGVAAAALANGLQVALKRRINRRRPCAHLPRSALRIAPPPCSSFPSGHSMNAFAFATLVALAHPVSAVPLLAVAASVAASRVALGLHYVSDVVAGALLGAGIGTAVCSVLR